MSIKESIVARASRCIDEVYPSPNDINAPFLPIEQFIDEAANWVIRVVPVRALGKGAEESVDVIKGVGDMPESFCRLISFTCKSWHRPVIVPIYDTDAVYLQQANPYTRGTAHRPVVAICKGETKIELYPATDTSATMLYFKFDPKANSDWEKIPEILVPVIAWKTAEVVFTSISSIASAQACQAKVNELIQAL